MAKGQRLKPKQIVTLLRQIDVLTTNSKTLAQACKEVGITPVTLILSETYQPISNEGIVS